ncbi:mediator of RNA polymerase II transcription subunit 31 [Eremomyces bilateralis CBS 781.70]|uniref:Mediator of RNA polymerase II transcription subunit 31 n=1 Tax=Eremomyces bilateralis CBS 781.70 TaxID=1392243 RepID=A0A6G1GET8_9PEZI|nr:mediator of RNA polymerase II transcription subunit 31 [Eremomyces bilateralis CBS 781.70]KAF1816522.1 mediator of RNA polymerase II transcription subunit 31 [Eremomyces bilateralis CBS 781.70]
MTAPPPSSPKFNNHTRFEIELEFVQSLSNPWYLNHLAAQKYFDQPAFVRYLAYLQYWKDPAYARYLSYPGPTLRAIELLQEERFRRDILSPDTVLKMIEEGMKAGMEG